MKRGGLLRLAAGGTLAAFPLVTGVRAGAAQALRLATIPIDTGAQIVYADGLGMFAKHGFEPTIQSISNGAAIVAATMGGAVDIGYSNIVSLAVAYKRGLPLTIVAPAAIYNPRAKTSALLVRNDSPIKTAADCNGKTFGVSALKSITQYSTQAWMDKNGGDAKSIRLVEMPFPEIAPALAQGRIDVGHFAEPALTGAAAIGRLLADSYDAVAPRFLIAAYFAPTAYVHANPEVVKRFVEIVRESAIWANAHHRESGVMLAKTAKIEPATVAAMTRARYAERLSAEDVQPSIDVAVKYGGLERFPARQLIWDGAA